MSYDCCDGHSLCDKCQAIKNKELAFFEGENHRRVKRGPAGEGLRGMMMRLSPPPSPESGKEAK